MPDHTEIGTDKPVETGAAEPVETGTDKPKKNVNERTVIDATADLLQTVVDWLRQEAEAAVREKVILPLQGLGWTLSFGLAASALIMAGILMISIATLLLLADWLGWPAVLYAIGFSLVILSTVALYFRNRTAQK